MENKKIDFVVHEADMNRMERVIKRQSTTINILIFSIVAIVAGILIYSMLPEETYKASQEANGSQIEQNIGE
jgi:type IV secretory pathway component VirB8